MTHAVWKRHLSFSLALLLAIILPILISCDDNDHSGAIRPTPVVLTVGQPVTDSVAYGGFNAYSAAVTPGKVYKISMTQPGDDTDLRYFGGDPSFTTAAACAVDNTVREPTSPDDSIPEDCIVAASGSNLYFAVDGAYINSSAAGYVIAVEQVSVDTMNSSVPVLAGISRTDARIYAVPVTAGAPVVAAITGMNNDGDLHLFLDDKLSAAAACTTDNTRYSGSTPEDCRLTPGVLTLFLVVDSVFSDTANLLYTAFTTTAPAVAAPANEGTTGSPVPVSLNTPALGQVAFAGTSFYAVSGTTPGNRYTVSINGLTGNADLTVYNSSTFSGQAECLINNTFFALSTPESCTLSAAGSSLYFKVDANTQSGGAAFVTLVEPGP